jgi:hypothetical protein
MIIFIGKSRVVHAFRFSKPFSLQFWRYPLLASRVKSVTAFLRAAGFCCTPFRSEEPVAFIFSFEDEGRKFFGNVGKPLLDYMKVLPC